MTAVPRLSGLLAALLIAGCGPLVQIGGNAKPPASLLTLTATTPPAAYAGPAPTSASLAVETPAVPLPLQTLRLPVTTSATEVRYLTGATWDVQATSNYSLRLDAGPGGASGNGQIVVDTVMREQMIILQISDTLARGPDGQVQSYTVLQADGRPLPTWARMAEVQKPIGCLPVWITTSYRLTSVTISIFRS